MNILPCSQCALYTVQCVRCGYNKLFNFQGMEELFGNSGINHSAFSIQNSDLIDDELARRVIEQNQ